MLSPRDIIAQAMWRHNSVIENGEVVKELYPQDEFDCCADVVLDALDAAGVLVIDPTNRQVIEKVGDVIEEALDLNMEGDGATVFPEVCHALTDDVFTALRAAGEATP